MAVDGIIRPRIPTSFNFYEIMYPPLWPFIILQKEVIPAFSSTVVNFCVNWSHNVLLDIDKCLGHLSRSSGGSPWINVPARWFSFSSVMHHSLSNFNCLDRGDTSDGFDFIFFCSFSEIHLISYSRFTTMGHS